MTLSFVRIFTINRFTYLSLFRVRLNLRFHTNLKEKLISAMVKAKKGKSDDIGDSILATMLAVKMKRNDSCISFVAVMEARSMN